MRTLALVSLSCALNAFAQTSGSSSSTSKSGGASTSVSGASASLSTASTIGTSVFSSVSSVHASNATTSSLPTSTVFSSVNATSSLPSSSSLTSSSSSSTGSTTEPPLESTILHPPISSYTFSAFPSPSSVAPDPKVYPSTSPKHPPSVEGSPSVIPDFAPAWTSAYAKAKKLVSTFTLEEKVSLSTGTGWGNGLCVGNIGAVKKFPGLCLQDGPLGVRSADYTTAFPAGINAAATWNRTLIRQRGLAMGEEFRGKGINVALGPMMNLGRISQGGRNWEGFGADPYLSGEAAYETILGLQSTGVQACAKHYINNEQENMRTQESSNVDDRAQHELYAAPFLRSVMAGVTSVMCSYNLVNGTYACENDYTLNHILKEEFGFQGYVMSDWGGTHSTIAAIAGLDMDMPGDLNFDGLNNSYFGANLTAYVQNNTIPESRLDDMATRILAGWYLLEQDSDFPAVNFNSFNPDDESTNQHVDVQGDHAEIVRTVGAASTVLLKNTKKALPLKKPRSIVLVGTDAGPGVGLGPNTFAYQGGVNGVLGLGWGSGSANFSYLVSPLEAIQGRARKDHTTLSWFLNDWDLEGASNAAALKDVAIVFIQSDSGENIAIVDGNNGDRNNITAWNNGDELVLAVAAQNKNTIVVTHSVGPLIVEPWIDHPNITAVVWAGLSATETGNALADVLYGDWNPTGRLPYTIAKRAEDYSAQLVTGGSGSDILSIPYTEGLFIDYRHFDAKNITPRYEFGFGLSYTKFKYSDIDVKKIDGSHDQNADLETNWAKSKPGPHGVGSSTALWLHRPAYNVSFTIQNVGDVYGGEIPQLYVNHPASAAEPPSILRGFTHVELNPGEKKRVFLTLSRYDLSIWDVVAQSWRRPQGTIKLTIGASSRDGRLSGTISA